MTRRKLTTLDKLKVLTAQARCPLCGEKLGALEGLDFDHELALVLGGEDAIENLRAVHRDCHKAKTSGRRGESDLSISGDGDVSRAAKVRRLIRKHEGFRPALPAPDPETAATEPRKGRTIPSRPFPKAKRRFGQ